MEGEIDTAVEQLRQRGARTIIVAGHSFGAAGAVRYATRHPVDGVIALAPGHYPEGKYFSGVTAESRNKAQAMVDTNKPDESGLVRRSQFWWSPQAGQDDAPGSISTFSIRPDR
jgi:pimeloyl-ACP methyl ester carboxylesterase